VTHLPTRRVLALPAIVAAAGLGLAACGSSSTNTAATTPTTAATTTTAAAPASSPSASGSGITCASGTLNFGGSTAQTNAVSAWVKAYETRCSGATINYNAEGSGAGVIGFENGLLTFAGSDYPLSASQAPAANAHCKGTAVDIPMVPGPIGVGFDLPGVTALNLSASVLGDIYNGKIKKWDDAAITSANPGVSLPDLTIQTFHRSDASGTSFNFSNYLHHLAPAAFPAAANKNWPGSGGLGEKGSAAVAAAVKSTAGGIGYFEQSFALQAGIPLARVSNASGRFVTLSIPATQAFLAKATSTGTGNDDKLHFDYADTSSTDYPNLLVTYEIACQSGNPPATLALEKDFLHYIASPAGQGILQANGYFALPADIQARDQAAIASLS
jgi:phosphate transport system substrate-binding protein